MKSIRLISTILLLIPIGMVISWIFYPVSSYSIENDNREILWLLIVLPILLLNFHSWIDTHIIENIITAYKKEFHNKTDQISRME